MVDLDTLAMFAERLEKIQKTLYTLYHKKVDTNSREFSSDPQINIFHFITSKFDEIEQVLGIDSSGVDQLNANVENWRVFVFNDIVEQMKKVILERSRQGFRSTTFTVGHKNRKKSDHFIELMEQGKFRFSETQELFEELFRQKLSFDMWCENKDNSYYACFVNIPTSK
jgi:hypothetical protein